MVVELWLHGEDVRSGLGNRLQRREDGHVPLLAGSDDGHYVTADLSSGLLPEATAEFCTVFEESEVGLRKMRNFAFCADHKIYCEETGSDKRVETDCMEGKRGGNGRVLLSILFPQCTMQLLYVLEVKTQENVENVFIRLRNILGDEDYFKLFSVILTDRGSEFRDAEGLERAGGDVPVTRVFYCDAMNSNQKARCERNHEELRRILPKGTDITFDQDTALLITNHIANISRPNYSNCSAYDLFFLFFGKKVAKKSGLYKIPAKDVVLSPSLIK